MKFIVDKENYGVILKHDKHDIWNISCYSDSDWSSDPDGRKSITGWEIFICGCLVGWGSRGQKFVTLYSTEDEYVSLEET